MGIPVAEPTKILALSPPPQPERGTISTRKVDLFSTPVVDLFSMPVDIPNRAANAQGTIFEIKDPETDAFIAVCGINSITMNGMTRAELDITTLCSTMKEFAPDLPDPGSLEIAGFLVPGDESQVVMRALFISGETTEWRITSPVEGYTEPFKMEGLGWVSGMPINFASGSVKSISFPVRLTGQITFTDPTNTPTP